MGFRSSILAGDVLLREAIQSPDYAAGAAGWSINRDGTAEFNDVTVRGEIISGTATDYVKVTPTPVPAIEWVSSSVTVTDPARVGFDSVGDARWGITGPSYSAHAPSSVVFDDGSLTVEGNSDVTMRATTGVARVNGSTVQLGGSAPGTYVELDPNSRTLVTYGVDRGKGIRNYTAVAVSTALG
ncbi:hypothetical protein ACFTUC_41485, partial [Streptomyces sp. NPDC056944]|uniref:phage tail tip fiber protein n=1 Tax=Streptomyces sp. NPDC056944 TaxID=3345972 RepID=UPI0036368F02